MTTILVVEDDELVAMSLQLRLQSLGYIVVTAYNASDAEQQAAVHSPNLVLTDICLPGGDGFEVAERLGTDAKGGGVAIIFATASLDPAIKQRAQRTKAAGFLQKPFTTEQLSQAIGQALLARAPPGSSLSR